MIAVMTPTYNRANLLPRLYHSLKKQNSFNFTWYIIDDGSTDNTEDVCTSFLSDEFKIIYLKKDNGGKHTAINEALKIVVEELFFIVDSDDILADNAISVITNNWKEYRDNHSIAGLSYYKMYFNGEIVGDKYKKDPIIDSYINVRVNGRNRGDKAEVFRTEILRQFSFPVFKGEKFLSEAIVWNAVSHEYKMAFIGKPIYFCEYQNDGLSHKGRRIQIDNPLGTMAHAASHINKKVRLLIQIKYMILYIAAAKFANVKLQEAARNSNNRPMFYLCLPNGCILYLCWLRKYAIREKTIDV